MVYEKVIENDKAVAIEHMITRALASLDDFGHEVTDDWTIDKGHDAMNARLCKGKLSQLIWKLLSKADRDHRLFKPLCLECVPKAGSASAALAVRVERAIPPAIESAVAAPLPPSGGGDA